MCEVVSVAVSVTGAAATSSGFTTGLVSVASVVDDVSELGSIISPVSASTLYLSTSTPSLNVVTSVAPGPYFSRVTVPLFGSIIFIIPAASCSITTLPSSYVVFVIDPIGSCLTISVATSPI